MFGNACTPPSRTNRSLPKNGPEDDDDLPAAVVEAVCSTLGRSAIPGPRPAPQPSGFSLMFPFEVYTTHFRNQIQSSCLGVNGTIFSESISVAVCMNELELNLER